MLSYGYTRRFESTILCDNGIARSMSGAWTKEIVVALYVTHADLSRNDHCATNLWQIGVCKRGFRVSNLFVLLIMSRILINAFKVHFAVSNA